MSKIILHLLAMSSYSGAENVVCQIIKMFEADEDVKMIYCSPDGSIRKVLQEKNIEYEPIEELSVKQFHQVIKKIKPDVVHAHDVKASVIAAAVCGKIPLITHMHSDWMDDRNNSLKSIMYLYPAMKAKKVLWVSESAYDKYFFKKIIRGKCEILYNIIDVDEVRKKADYKYLEKQYDVVYVGRLTYQKNPERLLNILSLVVKKNTDVKIAFIGDGDLKDMTEHLSDKLKIKKNVDFLGFVDNPHAIVKNARVFFMASRWEGTPMSVLEALSVGTPVVSAPVGGIKRVVIDGENGYLSDDDEILAERILEILQHENLQKQLSENAKIYSEKYNDIAVYKSHLADCYAQCR